jgi:thiol:disulfide interchange protein DsbD
MNRMLIVILVATVGLSIGCGAASDRVDPSADATVPGATVATHGDVEVAWENDWDAAFEKARAQDKMVLASFEAEWCVWCRRLETTTYRDAKVASLLGSTVVPVALDVDRNGRELSDTYEVDGLPTVVVFDIEGRELGRIDGYMPPGSFLERLEAILAQRG